jgi:hypothetical protein
MDYQASTRSCKEIIKCFFLQKQVALTAMLFLCFWGTVSADDPAPNPLTESISVSATVLAGSTNTPLPPNPPSPNTGPVDTTNTFDVAIFKGKSYPGSTISLLKNGIVMADIPANPDGTFELHVRNLNPGTYSFGLRAKDDTGLTSKLLVFTVYISASVATIVDGIFIPPTITSDKLEVKKGDPITFLGRSVPDTEVRISLTNNSEVIKKVKANSSGSWVYILDSSELAFGDYNAKARALTSSDISIYSDLVSFRVGETNRNRLKSLYGYRKRCDLNDDGRVNLLDFSIMAFWYKRLTFPPKVDLNDDKRVNLTDLSILAYCWTG